MGKIDAELPRRIFMLPKPFNPRACTATYLLLFQKMHTPEPSVTQLRTTHPNTFDVAGTSRRIRKMEEDALSDYARAIAIDPTFGEAYTGSYIAAFALGDEVGQQKYFEKAQQYDGDEIGAVQRSLEAERQERANQTNAIFGAILGGFAAMMQEMARTDKPQGKRGIAPMAARRAIRSVQRWRLANVRPSLTRCAFADEVRASAIAEVAAMADPHEQEVIAPDGSIIHLTTVAHPENWEHTYTDHRHAPPPVPTPVQHAHPKAPHVPSPPHPSLGDLVHNAEAAVVHGVQAGWNFVAGDDINTLRDPRASAIAKTIAGASLIATAIPGVGEEKLVAKAGLKVGEEVVEKVAEEAAERAAKMAAEKAAKESGQHAGHRFMHGVGEHLKEISHAKGIGKLAAAGATGYLSGQASNYVFGKVKEEHQKLFPPAPSYISEYDQVSHVMHNGESMSGKATISESKLHLTMPNGEERTFDYQVILDRSDRNHTARVLQQAKADGLGITLSYSDGQCSVFEAGRGNSPLVYSVGGREHPIEQGFSSPGRIAVGDGTVMQQLPGGEVRTFDKNMLIENSASPTQMKIMLDKAKASSSPTDMTFSFNGGHFFGNDRSVVRSANEQTQHR